MPAPTDLPVTQPDALDDAVNIDDLAARSLALFEGLDDRYAEPKRQVEDVQRRLSLGEIRLAVMGQFKRGKSTFINRLVGLDILPASVVPVTSIPTFLRFGPETRCTIRFYDGKPDLVVRQSVAEMTAALTAYVTEEKNPVNRLCVSEAIVECDNSVLRNGTTLIDTPGFGSTFVHNTKTTVDLVKGCDAVLFLLSADPPFTQTEAEFLKEVKRYVPRIFFIINKIDQLTEGELALLDSFVRKVLTSELSFASDAPLFHVSARNAGSGVATGAVDAGGMARVKTEIIDFMVREKYFTLSMAVSGKLRIALAAAADKLAADCRELDEPLASSARAVEAFDRHCEQVRIRRDKEFSLIDVEVRALGEFVDKTLASKKEELVATLRLTLERLVDGALFAGSKPQLTVESAFGPLTDEMFGRLFEQVAHAVSKPLVRAVELPRAQFVKILHEVRAVAPQAVAAACAGQETGPVSAEIPRFTPATASDAAAAFASVRIQSPGLFASKKTRRDRTVSALFPAAARLVDERFEQLSLHVKNAIRKACDACRADLTVRYAALLEKMKAGREEMQQASAGKNESVRQRLALLTEKRRVFEDIAKRLA